MNEAIIMEEVLKRSLITMFPCIKEVIYNDPVTVINWTDGVKTVVRCQDGDAYSEKIGFLMCIVKRVYGNSGHYNEILKEFIPGYGVTEPKLKAAEPVKVAEEVKEDKQIEKPVICIDFDTAKEDVVKAYVEPLKSQIETQPIEEVKVTEPVVSESVNEEPTIETSVVEAPAIEEPIIIEEPVINEPLIEEPVLDTPTVKETVKTEEPNKDPEIEVFFEDDTEKQFIPAEERASMFVFQSI